jgi:hypothetical protein
VGCRARFRRFEVHFLKILPSAKSNLQEKTSEKGFSDSPEKHRKTRSGSGKKEAEQREEKNNNH